MPILKFEYSDNLKIDTKIENFLLEVHGILVQEIKTDLRTCRSSIIKNSHFLIGDGSEKNAYIMLKIQMLPGRADIIKNRLGELLLKKIKRDFSKEIASFDLQLRVYLTETEKNHYYGLEN